MLTYRLLNHAFPCKNRLSDLHPKRSENVASDNPIIHVDIKQIFERQAYMA